MFFTPLPQYRPAAGDTMTMRTVRALVLALASTAALPQISFGPSSSSDNNQQPAGEVDVAVSLCFSEKRAIKVQ